LAVVAGVPVAATAGGGDCRWRRLPVAAAILAGVGGRTRGKAV